MKAVILVGGEGTRLRPLTYTTVKAMVPILNKPFIEHMIRYLNRYGINDIVLAMGYNPEIIRNHFIANPQPDVNLIYNIENTPLGTAGPVKLAEKQLSEEESFLVLNGDIFTDLNLSDMINFHRIKKAMVTIALTPVEDPTQFGVVEIDSQQRIKRFLEKPKREEAAGNLINAGIYILDYEVMKYITDNKKVMFEYDVFPQLVSKGEPVFGYVADTYWIDMGTPEKYLKLNSDLLLGKCSFIRLQAENINPQSQIPSDTRLIPPVLIDKGCIIGKNVELKGPLVIGSDCVISDNVIIEDSILWQRVNIGKGTVIRKCIIASNSNIDGDEYINNTIVCQNTSVNHPALANSIIKTGG